MGRPKLLLPWAGTSIVGYLVALWRSLPVRQIALVCREADQALALELDRLAFPAGDRIWPERPEAGMFSSIQCAARWPGWDKGLSQFLIVLGDQPQVKRQTLETLLARSAGDPRRIYQPFQRGPRHPVVLPRASFLELAAASQTTLHDYLGTDPGRIQYLEMADPGLILDIDRPRDYQAAQELVTPGPSPPPS